MGEAALGQGQRGRLHDHGRNVLTGPSADRRGRGHRQLAGLPAAGPRRHAPRRPLRAYGCTRSTDRALPRRVRVPRRSEAQGQAGRRRRQTHPAARRRDTGLPAHLLRREGLADPGPRHGVREHGAGEPGLVSVRRAGPEACPRLLRGRARRPAGRALREPLGESGGPSDRSSARPGRFFVAAARRGRRRWAAGRRSPDRRTDPSGPRRTVPRRAAGRRPAGARGTGAAADRGRRRRLCGHRGCGRAPPPADVDRADPARRQRPGCGGRGRTQAALAGLALLGQCAAVPGARRR